MTQIFYLWNPGHLWMFIHDIELALRLFSWEMDPQVDWSREYAEDGRFVNEQTSVKNNHFGLNWVRARCAQLAG
jgi:hypothetical protein